MKVVCEEKKEVNYHIECTVVEPCCSKMKEIVKYMNGGHGYNLNIEKTDCGNFLFKWADSSYNSYWGDCKKPKKNSFNMCFCPFCGEEIE